jgi:hypothetical protein
VDVKEVRAHIGRGGLVARIYCGLTPPSIPACRARPRPQIMFWNIFFVHSID